MQKLNLHFSIDDVLKSLIEVSDRNLKLTDHWFFSYLYKIYKIYNIKTCLYLFYECKINGKIRDLREIKSLKNQIKENWLHFGAHALNYQSPPHKISITLQKEHIEKIYKEIIRFAGTKYLAKNVRLHEYSECFEIKNTLKKYKIKSLFTTDRKIGSYRLNKNNSKELLKKGITKFKGQNFIRTDLRVENMISNTTKKNSILIDEIFKKKKFLILYTHEYELKKKKCRFTLDTILKTTFSKYKVNSMIS